MWGAGEREMQRVISGDLRVLNPIDRSWSHRFLNLPKQYHLVGARCSNTNLLGDIVDPTLTNIDITKKSSEFGPYDA